MSSSLLPSWLGVHFKELPLENYLTFTGFPNDPATLRLGIPQVHMLWFSQSGPQRQKKLYQKLYQKTHSPLSPKDLEITIHTDTQFEFGPSIMMAT